MGTSNQPRRSKLFAWLAGFVVVFAAVSWIVSGGIGRRGSPVTVSHTATLTPPPTPPDCRPDQLQVTGAFNYCADIAASFCGVSAQTLDDVFVLRGAERDFTLNIGVSGGYLGPGDYGLNNVTGEVDIRDNTTNAFWESLTGVLTVTTNSGRSGTVNANLDPWAGNAGVHPYLPLRVQGSWTCGSSS
jgi:hypothetical protein